MLHIQINMQAYPVNTKDEIETAQAEMIKAGLSEAEVWTGNDLVEEDSTYVCELSADPLEDKAYALASAIGVSPLGCAQIQMHGDVWTSDDAPGEYRVLDSDERDSAWNGSLDSYIDDCILAGESEVFQRYFDRDAWKRDARHDGAGHSLASYDSEEREAQIDGQWYFIYRVG